MDRWSTVVEGEEEGRKERCQVFRKEDIFFFLFSCKCCVEFRMQREDFVTLQILMYLMDAAFRFPLVHRHN